MHACSYSSSDHQRTWPSFVLALKFLTNYRLSVTSDVIITGSGFTVYNVHTSTAFRVFRNNVENQVHEISDCCFLCSEMRSLQVIPLHSSCRTQARRHPAETCGLQHKCHLPWLDSACNTYEKLYKLRTDLFVDPAAGVNQFILRPSDYVPSTLTIVTNSLSLSHLSHYVVKSSIRCCSWHWGC